MILPVLFLSCVLYCFVVSSFWCMLLHVSYCFVVFECFGHLVISILVRSNKGSCTFFFPCRAAKVPELRYACACGTCVASSEGYLETRDDAVIFRSLAFECRGQTVVCPDCCLAKVWMGTCNNLQHGISSP